jgi:PAS domain S-box-containing protein
LKEIFSVSWHRLEALMRQGWPSERFLIQRSDAIYLIRVNPIMLNDFSFGAVIVFQERSELDQLMEQTLPFQENTKELDAILDSLHDGLLICDQKTVVLRINGALERMYNVKPEQVLGREVNDLVSEGFLDFSVVLEVLQTHTLVNILGKTKEGRKILLSGNPIFDKKGLLFRVVVVIQDITETDSLYRTLEHQEAVTDQFRNHLLELQLREIESKQIIARSISFVELLKAALRVSKVDSTVLITGESGVGKELIADLIHRYSKRSDSPMIKVNCGAIPTSLVESELFGYEKGAFTGALDKGKLGYCELADGGILFLDEISELPMSSQVKLLRFLQDGSVTRLGGTVTRKMSVRVIAATNRDLLSMLNEGTFRKDLFYRLNVVPLYVPPLRQRRECIMPLIFHYIEEFSSKSGIKRNLQFTRKAINSLLDYSYPGNVRELINLCERLVVMSEKDVVDNQDLPEHLVKSAQSDSFAAILEDGKTLDYMIGTAEKEILSRAIKKYGSQLGAASALGVNQSTIARKLRKYGLK